MTDTYTPAQDPRPSVELSDMELAWRLTEGITDSTISVDHRHWAPMAAYFAMLIESGQQYREFGPDRTREAIVEAASRMVRPLGHTVVKQEAQ